MSISGSHHQDEAKFEELGNRYLPPWLDPLLKTTFFGPCLLHEENKNKLVMYCIPCTKSVCKYCVSSGSHTEHELIKIHRHVYGDVVPVEDMELHINCAEIQSFKCNGKLIISLNPLPHLGSGELFPIDSSCCVCKRKLHEPKQYKFCSITCKVNAHKTKSHPTSFVPVKRSKKGYGVAESSQKRKHRRK